MNGIEKVLIKARENMGFTQQEVADKAHINIVTYRSYENGVRKPKYSTAVEIQNVLDVDIVSILFPQNVSPPAPKEVIPIGKHIPIRGAPEWAGLPMYNVPITASFIATYRDESYMQPLYYFDDPRFKDCDFGAIITGDSMHSEIRHGDYIACKEVTDIGFIVFGEIYYVVAKNGLETCKYINAHPTDENRLLLVPRNEKISPSPIPKDMILKLYKVRGIIRGY